MKLLGHDVGKPVYVPKTAWLRHGPFAMWLVKAARPKRIVELGSHYGYSYFAFCQAVKEAGLSTECFAVDTWRGDEHAGFYGDEVFNAVQDENKEYKEFSTLLRMTFAEALNEIEDGSVDLLHIDGRHFYDDVKEDFESWIPKLSERAVVLFHDTEVHERGFGVHRFWSELSQRHSTLNFTYQHGLGVLFWGGDLTPEMEEFRKMSETEPGRDALVAMFLAQGEGLAADQLKNDLVKANAHIAEIENSLAKACGRIVEIEGSLAEAKSRNADVEAQYRQLSTQSHHAIHENQSLRHDLAYARSRAHRVWKDYLVYKALTKIAASRLPFPDKTRAKFQRSATKRDPKRSLGRMDTNVIGPQETGLLQGRVPVDPARQNVLLVSHEASWTGAPILVQNLARELCDRYNVSVICLRGGELLDAFLNVSSNVAVLKRAPERGDRSWKWLAKLIEDSHYDFAVVNSVESRHILPILQEARVPTVTLLHEFASYTLPRTAFGDAIDWSDQVVFSTTLTRENAVEVMRVDSGPKIHVFPQGKCIVPANQEDNSVNSAERERLRSILRPNSSEEEFLVIGAGTVHIRKGVDLFIETARKVLSSRNDRKIRFVWIGAGYRPDGDAAYSVYLKDQIKRSGIADRVQLLPETTEIEYVYELADAFMLTSRLDPLPNVAIDSMLTGLPVLCFDKASGIPQILRDGNLAGECIASYLDTSEMAERVLALAESAANYSDVSKRIRTLAGRTFDMKNYVAQIDDLAKKAIARRRNFDDDCLTIAGEGGFAPGYMLPAGHREESISKAAKLYLESLSVGRRPEPGFNPHVYEVQRPAETGVVIATDPYADFIRSGRPSGPWLNDVIWGPTRNVNLGAWTERRIALHIHAYYVDELPVILTHLYENRARPALYVSVVDAQSAKAAERLLESYGASVTVRIVPNLGRDIGPFLTEFGAELVEKYDVVGHVHTKKSLALSRDDLVENWTTFLFENILGGKLGGAMLDRILLEFDNNQSLGIVYPSDPHLCAWTSNRPPARDLASRLGIQALPEFFDFPVGTMFWMRSEALKPFIGLGLEWADYPREPIDVDGTMLHALERYFGIIPHLTGFVTAVTSVKGLTR